MTEKDDGGPAFPTPKNEFGEHSHSMSLRDYFAAHAMTLFTPLEGWLASDDDFAEVAKRSYWLADAMLAARRNAD